MTRALLIIDIQCDYFPGGAYPLVEPSAAAATARRLLDAFRASGEPVVHLKHVWDAPDATFMRPGTDGVEIHPLVAPADRELVIEKQHPNGFLGTDLADVLDGRGIDTLVVAGMMSSMCVDATVRAGADLGLTSEQYEQFRLALEVGKPNWVTVPRHLDAMTWASGGQVHVLHDVIIPANQKGVEVDLHSGDKIIALFLPAKCGNLSVIRRSVPHVASAVRNFPVPHVAAVTAPQPCGPGMVGSAYPDCSYPPVAAAAPPPVVAAGAAPPGTEPPWEPPARDDALGVLAAAERAARERGISEVETFARVGEGADAILDVAEEQRCELIVLGHTGLTGATRFLLGSVTTKVSQYAPCSVLIVRTG